jgi:hypothetical protein
MQSPPFVFGERGKKCEQNLSKMEVTGTMFHVINILLGIDVVSKKCVNIGASLALLYFWINYKLIPHTVII